MFDVGIWELLVVLVVALVVIGPQRLPSVATKLGHWVATMRRLRDTAHHEMRQELTRIQTDSGIDDLTRTVRSEAESLRQHIDDKQQRDD